jgi:peptide subunit release factor 1 (eRF1)
MIDQSELQELVGFQAAHKDTTVLSLYLDVDPRQRTVDEYRLALRHLLASVDGQATKQDRALIERYVEREYDRQSRGLICFSCAAENLWYAFPMMTPVTDVAFAGVRPYVKPLSDILDTYSRYGVVLVDKEGARIFLFNLGVVEGVTDIIGEDIKRHKQGGRAAARYQRHEDEAAYRNQKDAAEMTAELVRSGDIRRLILAGTDENLAQFTALLPKQAQQAVLASIGWDAGATLGDIGEQSMALIRAADAARKHELVERLITAASKGASAVVGLANTLAAGFAGRAYHLVLDDNFSAPAVRCDNCGYVGVEELAACPSCGAALRVLPDAADSLVRWAIGQDVEVTFVHDSAALKDAGQIGAFLRY